MSKLVAARHHWWPECVSRHWADAKGMVHWLKPDGTIKESQPKSFGAIRNGHQIRLGERGEVTVWDQDFESVFQSADDDFPEVIQWLEKLAEQSSPVALPGQFCRLDAIDEPLQHLVEGLVSLAVRSPMTREACVSVAEYYRGPLPAREREAIIALNMRDLQKRMVSSIGTRGKFVILSSADREFIFGDGFYHNFSGPNPPMSPTILAPLTPQLSVLFSRPMRYMVEPRLTALHIGSDMADELNRTVMIYSKGAIFYRNDAPPLIEEYRVNKHLRYDGLNHPIDRIVQRIPGVAQRDDRHFGLF